MARCLITRELPGRAAERLAAAGHEVEVRRERMPPTHDQLVELAPRFDALLTLLTDPIDEEVIASAPDLRAIANYAVGTDTSTSTRPLRGEYRWATHRTCSPKPRPTSH